MSNTTGNDRIGPRLDLTEVSLPPAVGKRLATLLDARGRLDTAAGWAAAMRSALVGREGRLPQVDDLCTAADGAHTFESAGGDRESFVCVLDPLVVPFLTDTPGTVHSTPPAGGEVTVEVTTDGATATPGEAVVSLGVADKVSPGEIQQVYRAVCPYVHAFDSRASYESWLAGVKGHATAVPVETGVGVARELATALFGERSGES